MMLIYDDDYDDEPWWWLWLMTMINYEERIKLSETWRGIDKCMICEMNIYAFVESKFHDEERIKLSQTWW
jgi:hypothetical protein